MAGGAQENLTGGETDQQMLSVIQGVMGQLMGGGGNSTTIGEFLNTLAQLCGGEEPEDQPNDLPGHGEHCGKQPHPCHHGRVLFLSMHCSDLERMFQMEGDGGGDIVRVGFRSVGRSCMQILWSLTSSFITVYISSCPDAHSCQEYLLIILIKSIYTTFRIPSIFIICILVKSISYF